MTGETSERVARKILEYREHDKDMDTHTLARTVGCALGIVVTEAEVVRVLDEARAEKMRGAGMSDAQTMATVEYRHERADDLFRRYVEQLHLAQSTHDADDWIKTGSLFHRFCDAAIGAGLQPFKDPYGSCPSSKSRATNEA